MWLTSTDSDPMTYKSNLILDSKLHHYCFLLTCDTCFLSEKKEEKKKMMHRHIATKSNLVDSGHETNRLGFRDNDGLPLCPKPRRLGPAIPNFLAPLRCADHIHSQSSSEGRAEILNIIAGKNVEGRDCLCSNCYPSCYSGSPPRRTENPLVHDVYFLHQMELLSPFSRTKLSDKFSLTSASPT